MKVFLDANILISVLNKEYPVFTYSSRVLSLSDHTIGRQRLAEGDSKFKMYTSPLCLAIAFYFASKKSSNAMAREKINLLAQKLSVTSMGQETVIAVSNNKNIHDFEDGLQYYSALESGCKYIVTEDRNDFYFSEIEVLTSRLFLEKYFF